MTDHYSEQRNHTEQLNELISRQRNSIDLLTLQRDNYKATTEAAMAVSGQIKKAAFELGYQESMGCTELDYIIELARACTMVNDRNLELVQRYEHLMENNK